MPSSHNDTRLNRYRCAFMWPRSARRAPHQRAEPTVAGGEHARDTKTASWSVSVAAVNQPQTTILPLAAIARIKATAQGMPTGRPNRRRRQAGEGRARSACDGHEPSLFRVPNEECRHSLISFRGDGEIVDVGVVRRSVPTHRASLRELKPTERHPLRRHR